MSIDAPYRARLAACGLGSPGAVLDRVDGEVVAWSRSTDVVFLPCPDGGPGFYVKRYRYGEWGRRLRGALRGTLFGRHRGELEYRLLTKMRNLGLPVVRPVAFGVRYRWRFVDACFLITEAAPSAENLTTFATAVCDGRRALSIEARREMTTRLAQEMARLHESGFSHGQLYWRNIVVRHEPRTGSEFFFLDARPRQRQRRLARRTTWWRDELAQFTASATPFVTRTDARRFLRAYCRARTTTLDERELYRECARLAPAYEPHERQRIRMNTRFSRWNQRLAAENSGNGA